MDGLGLSTTLTLGPVLAAVRLSTKAPDFSGSTMGAGRFTAAADGVKAERRAPSTNCAQWIFMGGSGPSGAESSVPENESASSTVFPAINSVATLGDGDGGFAAKRLERGAIDDLAAARVFLEFHPHAQHIAAIRAAGGSHGIGVFHFTQVFGPSNCILDALFQGLGG